MSIALMEILQEEGFVDEGTIVSIMTYLYKVTKDYGDAKFDETMAKAEWEETFASGLANGLIVGKNAEERLGSAIEQWPDKWISYKNAKIRAEGAKAVYDAAMVVDRTVSRLLRFQEQGLMAGAIWQRGEVDTDFDEGDITENQNGSG